VQAPGEVERGIAHPRVAPVDHARDTPVADEHVLRTEIAMHEHGLEVELRDRGEQLLGPRPLVVSEQGQDSLPQRAAEALEVSAPGGRVEEP
jgi:hypothetical protein